MLIDCFSYFNEKELLELRIRTLEDTVDFFMIADANRTHKGEPKEYTAVDTIKELGLPQEKIQVLHVELPGPEEVPDPWVRERGQRDALGVGIDMIEGDHVFIVSDCDEIANPEALKEAVKLSDENPDEFIRLSMPFLMNRADLQCHNADGEPMEWVAGTVIRSSHVRNNSTLSAIRSTPGGIKVGNLDAGWHFSWMGDAKRLQTKVSSFAHCYDVIPSAAAPLFSDEMLQFMENYKAEEGATDPLGRKDHILKPYQRELLPEKLFKIERVKEFLLPDDNDEI